jgi:flavin reductase (DIM6/NTAB) family NADH-FMN oxidoreductase RutF/DNA-binding transcriptional LysR family regulator
MNERAAPAVDPVLRGRFVGAMSQAASTVNVVTTDGPAGRFGVTVSAMTSVSADSGPTLLVCINQQSRAAAALLENGVFCVNVLRDDQAHISDTFAGRFADRMSDKFACAQWTTLATGAPRVVDPLAAFDCRILSSERVGTHYVVYGAVQEVYLAESGAPLIYANRAYGRPQRLVLGTEAIDAGAADTQADALPAAFMTLSLGCFQTFAPHVLPALVAQLSRLHPEVAISLLEGDQPYVLGSLRAGEIDVALLYDFDLGEDIAVEPMAELSPYVLLPAGHDLAARNEIDFESLVDLPLILLDLDPSRDYFLSLFRQRDLEPLIGYRSRSFEMVRGLVGQGLGYSLLATHPATRVSYDGHELVSRPLGGSPAHSRLVIARVDGRPLQPTASAFIAQCREFFRTRAL